MVGTSSATAGAVKAGDTSLGLLCCRVYAIVVGRMGTLEARAETTGVMLVSWAEKWKEKGKSGCMAGWVYRR
jgi:hypothetical protein